MLPGPSLQVDGSTAGQIKAAPEDALFVIPQDFQYMIRLAIQLRREDVTFIPPTMLEEDVLAQVDRPVVVVAGLSLTAAQRDVLEWHRTRIA